LALAHARRLHREGAITASVEAFRHAETLLDDADFRARCRAERKSVSPWLPGSGTGTGAVGGASQPPASMSELVRDATIHLHGQAGARVSGDPLGAESGAHLLVSGIRSLLAGDLGPARRSLDRAAPASVSQALARDLATVVLEVVDGSTADAAARLEEVVLTADLKDEPWFARMGRGLQGALLLGRTGEPWRLESCASLVDECVRLGDDWGCMLLTASVGVALVVRRDERADAWLARAWGCARSLGAPVLGAWCSTLRAVRAELTDVGAGAAGPALRDRARSEATACGLGPVAEHLTRRRAGPGPLPVVATCPASQVRVTCLGTFGIEVDGKPLTLSGLRPLPRALLIFLALRHGQNVHREVLIDWLWPEASVESASHRLHTAASALRRCLDDAGLGEKALQQQYGAYRLALGDAVLDVAEFEAAVHEASVSESRGELSRALELHVSALELYRGDLLSDLGPADWVSGDRERLRVAAATSAQSAGLLCLRVRPPAEALPLARRATELDPLRDSAWALLEEIQTLVGDFGSAAATRLAHRAAMAELALPGVRRTSH
jgi:DNA-binding SARP family transcriptional activator